MEPMFFGTGKNRLYGVYHEPDISDAQKGSVLLCYPSGHEYIRIHRAFRQMASLLARAGFAVLRFDYRGTGDSTGIQEDMTCESWVQDTIVAGEELMDLSRCRQINVLGLRLGATVAALSCSHLPVDKLGLWEPFSRTEEFFDQRLEELENDINFNDQCGGFHYNGFHYVQAFCESFSRKDIIATLTASPPSKVGVFSGAKNPSALKLNGILPRSELIGVDQVNDWTELDAMGGIFLTQNALSKIVEWFQTS